MEFSRKCLKKILGRLEGFEPSTSRTTIWRYYQLSYSRRKRSNCSIGFPRRAVQSAMAAVTTTTRTPTATATAITASARATAGRSSLPLVYDGRRYLQRPRRTVVRTAATEVPRRLVARPCVLLRNPLKPLRSISLLGRSETIPSAPSRARRSAVEPGPGNPRCAKALPSGVRLGNRRRGRSETARCTIPLRVPCPKPPARLALCRSARIPHTAEEALRIQIALRRYAGSALTESHIVRSRRHRQGASHQRCSLQIRRANCRRIPERPALEVLRRNRRHSVGYPRIT